MDVNKQVIIKTYSGLGLDSFDLIQALPCVQMTSTPLAGDSAIDLEMVDFGPLLIAKRSNTCSSLEEQQFSEHTLAFQLPMADASLIQQFIALPGGDRRNPFQCAGAESQWLIPAGMPLFHIQVDAKWLVNVLGGQLVQDYTELCNVSSRKAYDASVLFSVAAAAQHAFDVAMESKRTSNSITAAHLESLVTDILLPCIMSDLDDINVGTRQKILSKALDYIKKNHANRIRLKDLSDVTATSVRNLQLVFKQELGISPSRYIQQFRLHRFRHHLVSSKSVSEAAYKSGFKHLGRLTLLYANVFAKNPSEDLLTNTLFSLEIGDQFEPV